MKPGAMSHSTANRKFFVEPRICARCRVHRPREGGRYVAIGRNRQEWVCAMHGEGK